MFEINEPILYGDSISQVYLIRSNEDVRLKQLEGKQGISTQLIIDTDEPRIGIVSGHKDVNTLISIVNMPVYFDKDNKEVKVNVYNNSYFKGISISKGDILGTLTISC